jgi:ketosteroid isomerase-like protein
MDSIQSEVKALLESWSEAVRNKDIDALMSLYSPYIVYFDLVPPLQITGADAVRRNFLRWFESWSSPIGTERREVSILGNDSTAAAYMLHRTSGTLKGGREVGYWVRVSVWCQRSTDGWRIAHEHVSLPVELQSGRVVMDLVP